MFWFRRLFYTPHPQELYVCYQDSIPQNLVDFAFKISLNSVAWLVYANVYKSALMAMFGWECCVVSKYPNKSAKVSLIKKTEVEQQSEAILFDRPFLIVWVFEIVVWFSSLSMIPFITDTRRDRFFVVQRVGFSLIQMLYVLLED